MKILKVIFFGPRVKSVFNLETIGGGTVLFENIIPIIKRKNSYININANSKLIIKRIFYNIKLIFIYIYLTLGVDKVLFVAHRQAVLFLFIDFLTRKKSVYRLIGGNFDYWFKSPLIRFLLRKNAKNLTILCELPKDVIFFKKLKIKTAIQENFRDLTLFKKNLKKIIPERKVIGFLGRICSEKGIFEFIELAEKCPDNNFVIVGPFQSEDYRKKIETSEKELNNLFYKGVLENSKIDVFFNQIDILFFHSNHIGEGKPGVLVEALIRRKPIITNYVVQCKNWSNFYNKNNIIFSENYSQTLSNFDFNRIIFYNKDLQIFSAKFCYNQIIKILKE